MCPRGLRSVCQSEALGSPKPCELPSPVAPVASVASSGIVRVSGRSESAPEGVVTFSGRAQGLGSTYKLYFPLFLFETRAQEGIGLRNCFVYSFIILTFFP